MAENVELGDSIKDMDVDENTSVDKGDEDKNMVPENPENMEENSVIIKVENADVDAEDTLKLEEKSESQKDDSLILTNEEELELEEESRNSTNKLDSLENTPRKIATPRKRKETNHIWISNVGRQIRAADLKKYFNKYSKVTTAKVLSNGSSLFGYVVMESVEMVEKAMQSLNNTVLNGRRLLLTRYRPDTKKFSDSLVQDKKETIVKKISDSLVQDKKETIVKFSTKKTEEVKTSTMKSEVKTVEKSDPVTKKAEQNEKAIKIREENSHANIKTEQLIKIPEKHDLEVKKHDHEVKKHENSQGNDKNFKNKEIKSLENANLRKRESSKTKSHGENWYCHAYNKSKSEIDRLRHKCDTLRNLNTSLEKKCTRLERTNQAFSARLSDERRKMSNERSDVQRKLSIQNKRYEEDRARLNKELDEVRVLREHLKRRIEDMKLRSEERASKRRKSLSPAARRAEKLATKKKWTEERVVRTPPPPPSLSECRKRPADGSSRHYFDDKLKPSYNFNDPRLKSRSDSKLNASRGLQNPWVNDLPSYTQSQPWVDGGSKSFAPERYQQYPLAHQFVPNGSFYPDLEFNHKHYDRKY